jgi:hypothetical protein
VGGGSRQRRKETYDGELQRTREEALAAAESMTAQRDGVEVAVIPSGDNKWWRVDCGVHGPG